MAMPIRPYRDRIYIRKDILVRLIQYGTLNQTTLLSYCGLNLKKHKEILDEMVEKGLISRKEVKHGKRRIIEYSITQKGIAFCKKILQPYEEMFPRKGRSID
ncbi:hypothetical protein DRO48_04435 [Candidatus Bathyarchaeota archaeon]|nr:MAG: hypothetical protein DRO48_04435 [Candidatus Bathyarchaeota archaeon]HDI42621.1 hypothetical protein [Candidatus Bathyarchaeota archaeon]